MSVFELYARNTIMREYHHIMFYDVFIYCSERFQGTINVFQVNVLYLNTDNTLADCMEVENTSLKQNDVVQDYKKLAKKKQVL